MSNKSKTNKGITLIALIITVIVLLILAGTAVSITISGGNIFDRASNAKNSWNGAVAREESEINQNLALLNQILPSTTSSEEAETTPGDANSEESKNVFKYEIISQATGKTEGIDGAYEMGKVADNSDTIKIADNTIGTAKLTGVNWDYVFRDIEGDVDVLTLVKDLPEGRIEELASEAQKYLSTINIPQKVKLNADGEIDENGAEYNITTIGEFAFQGGEYGYIYLDIEQYVLEAVVTSAVLPNTITKIEGAAFYGCKNLASFNMPTNITTIERGAFSDTGITSITIPNGFTTVNDAFSGCEKLTSVTIPNTVTTIDEDAFECCTSLESISIPNSVRFIGFAAFRYSGLTSINIPNSVLTIGKEAFLGCENLTSVTIPSSIDEIEERTFDGCHSLSNVTIEYGVMTIGYGAFDSCYSLISITLPSSVGNISTCAFYSCRNLESINLENVGYIEGGAFGDCWSLENVTLPKNVYLEDEAFDYEGITITYLGSDTEWDELGYDHYNVIVTIDGEEVDYIIDGEKQDLSDNEEYYEG